MNFSDEGIWRVNDGSVDFWLENRDLLRTSQSPFRLLQRYRCSISYSCRAAAAAAAEAATAGQSNFPSLSSASYPSQALSFVTDIQLYGIERNGTERNRVGWCGAKRREEERKGEEKSLFSFVPTANPPYRPTSEESTDDELARLIAPGLRELAIHIRVHTGCRNFS